MKQYCAFYANRVTGKKLVFNLTCDPFLFPQKLDIIIICTTLPVSTNKANTKIAFLGLELLI